MTKILVTGGCGFIGSNFIRYLYDKNSDSKIEIINVDSLTYAGNLDNLKGISDKKNYFFENCDIRNLKEIDKIFNLFRPEIVVNFAAESHVDRSISNSAIFVETNIGGTNNLINLSLKYKIKKYIQVSTDEVYGDLIDNEPAFIETSEIKPSSPYAASKAAADLLVLSFYRTFNLPAIITRCSNNYGPYQHTEKLIPKVIRNSLDNKKIPIFGDGKNIRDWIYVDDHCSGILSAINNGKFGQIYNFGGNCEIRNIDIVKKILELTNSSNNLINFVEDRLGHDYRYAINSSKANNDLGWSPEVDFDAGISRTIEWYKSNNEWVQNLKI